MPRTAAPPRVAHPAPVQLMDTATCAEFLNLSRRTVENWRLRGGGPPFIKFGKHHIRYDLDAVRAWLTESTVTAGESR